ncbi:hypothetical protein AB0H57_21645 [Micromonospora sp. NPDC050686]|uniref:hypothetical protein n=1 Tax=Micromonospora sp. NPDC050686 TaxID=3154631 RepID=UPI0033D85AE5
MRSRVTVDYRWANEPVCLERIVTLPLEQIEITETVRAYHRESLVRSLYQRKDRTGEYAWPESAFGASYFQMAGLALDVLAPDRDFDLVVFVTATPDCQLTHYSAPQFNEALPGRPGFIGIGDQGAAGPFTAVRIVRNHLRFGLVERAIILIMEQALIPQTPDRLWVPRDSAVALVLSRRGGLVLGSEAISRNSAIRLPPGGSEESVLIQGNGMTETDFAAPGARFAQVWRPDGDYACTGVWETLASRLPQLRHNRVVLAEADQTLSYRSFLELTRPAGDDIVMSH